MWRRERGILYLTVASQGQPGTIHLGLISTGYVQINLQYLIISRIFYCLTYFSVKSCCTVLQGGAFKDMIYVSTYSRLFNTSQLMPSESVLMSGKTIQFGPVVEIKSLGFHI